MSEQASKVATSIDFDADGIPDLLERHAEIVPRNVKVRHQVQRPLVTANPFVGAAELHEHVAQVVPDLLIVRRPFERGPVGLQRKS